MLSIGPKVIIPGFYYFLSLIKTSYAVGDMLKMDRNFIIVLFIKPIWTFDFFLIYSKENSCQSKDKWTKCYQPPKQIISPQKPF